MQIVIDIPEEYYSAIKEISDENSTADMLLIKYGKPLPKGHGRLIDGDELSVFFKNVRSNLKPSDYTSAIELYTRDVMLLNAQQFVDASPTIIKADKEGENEWKKNIHSGKRHKRS